MAKMDAGPELDAVIARRVMGLQPCDAWERINLGRAGGPFLQKRCQHSNCYPRPTLGLVGGPPWYSTDIAAAWQIVEEMRRQGWNPCIEGGAYDNPHPAQQQWVCEMQGTEHVGKPGSYVQADTAPLAICRAALAAIDRATPGAQNG